MKRNILFFIAAVSALLLSVSCDRKYEYQELAYATLYKTSYSIAENIGQLKVPVLLNNAPGSDVQVSVKIIPGTAEKDTDYKLISPAGGVLTFSGDTDSLDVVIDITSFEGEFTGGKDFTIEIAQKVAPGSKVTGVDISEGMMTIGREKIQKAGLSAELSVADCEALPYQDDTFDRISVGFGVRNFEHLEIGLSEMFRVLAPGGKLVILELSVPSNAFIRWCYKLYFLKILPAIGGLVSGNRSAYEYLPASVLHFPAPDKFIGMMKTAGFGVVEHTPMTFGICRMYVGKKAAL